MRSFFKRSRTTSWSPDSTPLCGTEHPADRSFLATSSCWCPFLWRPHAACLLRWHRRANPTHACLTMRGLHPYWFNATRRNTTSCRSIFPHHPVLPVPLPLVSPCCLLAALARKGQPHACVFDDARPPSLLVFRHPILCGEGDGVQSAQLQMANAGIAQAAIAAWAAISFMTSDGR